MTVDRRGGGWPIEPPFITGFTWPYFHKHLDIHLGHRYWILGVLVEFRFYTTASAFGRWRPSWRNGESRKSGLNPTGVFPVPLRRLTQPRVLIQHQRVCSPQLGPWGGSMSTHRSLHNSSKPQQQQKASTVSATDNLHTRHRAFTNKQHQLINPNLNPHPLISIWMAQLGSSSLAGWFWFWFMSPQAP